MQNREQKKIYVKCLECGHVYDREKLRCPECKKFNEYDLLLFFNSFYVLAGFASFVCLILILNSSATSDLYGQNLYALQQSYKLPLFLIAAVEFIAYGFGLLPLVKTEEFLKLQNKIFIIVQLVCLLAYAYIITHMSIGGHSVDIAFRTFIPAIGMIVLILVQKFIPSTFIKCAQMKVED